MPAEPLATTFTEDIRVGDLCRFWDCHGIFLGVMEVSDVSVEPMSTEPMRLEIMFRFNGETYPRRAILTFEKLPIDYKPENFLFVALLVDDDIKILPRAHVGREHPYRDGLHVISKV